VSTDVEVLAGNDGPMVTVTMDPITASVLIEVLAHVGGKADGPRGRMDVLLHSLRAIRVPRARIIADGSVYLATPGRRGVL
jgi:hypothetical protein